MRMRVFPKRVRISMTPIELALVRRIVTERAVAELKPADGGQSRALSYWRRKRPPIVGVEEPGRTRRGRM